MDGDVNNSRDGKEALRDNSDMRTTPAQGSTVIYYGGGLVHSAALWTAEDRYRRLREPVSASANWLFFQGKTFRENYCGSVEDKLMNDFSKKG